MYRYGEQLIQSLRLDDCYSYTFLILLGLCLAKSFSQSLGVGALELITCFISVMILRRFLPVIVLYFLLIYAAFLVVLLLSSINSFASNSQARMAVVTQFLVYLKLPLSVVLLISLAEFSGRYFTCRLYMYTKYLLFFSLILCVFQLTVPSLVVEVFSGQYLDTYITGFDIRRMTGVYNHPTLLGYLSAISFIYLLSKPLSREVFLLLIISFILLLLSGQRGELVLLFACFPLAYLLRVSYKMFGVFGSGILSLIIYIITCMNFESIFGIDIAGDNVVRHVLYAGAYQVAFDYFPLGSGMATYGSSNSAESLVYYDTGIEMLWWFSKGTAFLTDTTWAMILAESGFIGTGVYLFFVSILLFYCVSRNSSIYSCAILSFILLESLSNPTFTSYVYVLVVGFAYALFSGGGMRENSYGD